MASDASTVLKRVKDEKVEFVRFWFTDIFGQLKCFAIDKDELEDAFDDGMGFDGSSITGFNRDRGVGHDRHARPVDVRDPAVARQENARRPDVLRRPHARRRALRGRPALHHAPRAGARAKELGFDDYYLGPELEFFYFKPTTEGPAEVLDGGGYFDLTTLDAGSDFRRDDGLRPARARHPRSSTPTTRSAPRSTRSTCASPRG